MLKTSFNSSAYLKRAEIIYEMCQPQIEELQGLKQIQCTTVVAQLAGYLLRNVPCFISENGLPTFSKLFPIDEANIFNQLSNEIRNLESHLSTFGP